MHGASLFLELGVVVLGLATLARVAGRFGVTPIPLYLLAGLAFGNGGVAPLLTTQRFIAVGAQIGVILLLLMLGLEFSGQELTTALRVSAPAGGIDLALNFTPGFAAGLLLGWGPMTSLFLGGVTYISSSGIVAKMVSDLGWIPNRETPVVLSILVLEDLVMVVYLPLLAALLIGGGVWATSASVGIAVVVMLITLVLAVRFGPSLSRLVFSHSDEVLLLTILGLTLIVAGLAESIQASAAVGAFLVGTALSGPAADRARPLLGPVRDLFAAVFFFFFGLETDPGTILPVLVTAVVLSVVTAGTKIATGRLAAKRAGVGPRAQRRAGVALIPRGEFSIVIAGIGIAAGLRRELAAVAAAYVLLLGIAGPVAARITDHRIHAEMATRERARSDRRSDILRDAPSRRPDA